MIAAVPLLPAYPRYVAALHRWKRAGMAHACVIAASAPLCRHAVQAMSAAVMDRAVHLLQTVRQHPRALRRKNSALVGSVRPVDSARPTLAVLQTSLNAIVEAPAWIPLRNAKWEVAVSTVGMVPLLHRSMSAARQHAAHRFQPKPKWRWVYPAATADLSYVALVPVHFC